MYSAPRSVCRKCGGPCKDAGLTAFQDRWVHIREEDWRDSPHDADPDPRDVAAAHAAFAAGYGFEHPTVNERAADAEYEERAPGSREP